MPSLSSFRKEYLRLNFGLQRIVDTFVDWVSEDVYLILSRWNKKKWKNDIFAVKCAKRGNDVYRSRVERRFRGLVAMAKDQVFFNRRARGAKATRALWVTLTYDTKLCSFKEAWENIGSEFNGFMSRVRRHFGKVSSCRVFESFENGYPHIHCILLFEKDFLVFRDHKGNFRVREKYVFAEAWHSNVDVKAMSSLAGGFAYLKKYLLKGIDFNNADSKALKTLALCWVFRKRAFSVSGHFRRALSDLIMYLHISNKKLVQFTLSGQPLSEEKFYILGFVSSEVLQIEDECWFIMLTKKQITNLTRFFSNRSQF